MLAKSELGLIIAKSNFAMSTSDLLEALDAELKEFLEGNNPGTEQDPLSSNRTPFFSPPHCMDAGIINQQIIVFNSSFP